MKTKRIALTLLATAAVVSVAIAQSRLIKSADQDEEKSMVSTIEVDYGVIKIMAGDQSRLFSVNALYNSDRMDPELVFKRAGSTAKLNFSTHSSGINMGDQDIDDETGKNDFTATFELGNLVQHDLNISVGAGASQINLSNLNVAAFTLSNGAGSCKLSSDTPNPSSIRTINIQSGVGEVDARGLSNLNFRTLNVNNGIGEIVLDFSGRAEGNKRVNIETGVGEIRVMVPATIGIMVRDNSSFFSNITVPRNFTQDDDVYYSPNYESAVSTIEFEVSTGIGEIRFQTIKDR